MGKNLNKRTLELEEETKDFKGKSKKIKGKFRNKWKGKDFNDSTWHGKNSEVVKTALQKAWNQLVGFVLKFKKSSTINDSSLGAMPSLKTFWMDWWAGASEGWTSMINSAATNMWSFVRSRNAGATNYEASDLFINTIAATIDVMVNITLAARILGCAAMYSVTNRLVPKMLVEAQGIQFEDLVSKIASYRASFNLLLAKASTMVIPKQFPIFDYIMSYVKEIFKDRDSSTGREQMYMITKKFFHIYDPSSSPQGGQIRLMKTSDIVSSPASDNVICLSQLNKITFEQLLTIIDRQIDLLIKDEDTNIMYGDLIKAYGSEGNFYRVTPITEDYTCPIIYSEEMLEQIHNATYIPHPYEKSTTVNDYPVNESNDSYVNTIEQDESHYIKARLYGTLDGARREYSTTNYSPGSSKDSWNVDDSVQFATMDLLLDTNEEAPDQTRVMNMTRLHSKFSLKRGTGSGQIDFTGNPGVGVVFLMDGFAFVPDYTGEAKYRIAQISQFFKCLVGSDNNVNIIAQVPQNLDIPGAFSWFPILYGFVYKYVNSTWTRTGEVRLIGDVNNVVTVDGNFIYNANEIDLSSLYDVPFTGKF